MAQEREVAGTVPARRKVPATPHRSGEFDDGGTRLDVVAGTWQSGPMKS
ncbi:hypothetical protein M1D88_16255 [Arthrobacter sp. R1-13]|nr:hypothetical protein [Arthrobacter sp.]